MLVVPCQQPDPEMRDVIKADIISLIIEHKNYINH